MSVDSLRRRLQQLRSSEAGIALPVALFAMVSSMALAGAAVVATVDVQHGAQRDHSSKTAIAAADAGANVARVRMSRFAYALNTTTPCLRMAQVGLEEKLEATATVESFGGTSWCPKVTGTVGGATYSYWVSPVGSTCGEYALCVVATGTAGGVTRRIEVAYTQSSLNPSGGDPAPPDGTDDGTPPGGTPSGGGGIEGLVGKDGITISGSAEARVNIGTNGYLVSDSKSVCGNVRTGIGKPWAGEPQCHGTKSEGNVELPSVASFIPSDIATNNSNGRITACSAPEVPAECQKDSFTGNWKSKPPFDPNTRRIELNGNDTLTVNGGDYWICSIKFNGSSQLIMAAGAHVRFFFDTPEHCGTSSQLEINGNNRIAATGYLGTPGHADVPGFYFLGSTQSLSQIYLKGNQGSDELLIYAPDSYVTLTGSATYKGAVVGREVHLEGNAVVEQDEGFELPPELNPTDPGDPGTGGDPDDGSGTPPTAAAVYFNPESYYECGGTALGGQPPNAGC